MQEESVNGVGWKASVGNVLAQLFFLNEDVAQSRAELRDSLERGFVKRLLSAADPLEKALPGRHETHLTTVRSPSNQVMRL